LVNPFLCDFLDKAAVFIDGGYFKKVRENFGDPKVDFLRVSEDLCKRCSCERFRTYIYDCAPYQSNPPTQNERDKTQKFNVFYTTIKRLPSFEFRLGKLQKINKPDGSVTVQQKGVDILLTIDLVKLAATKTIQKAILITGDSDFVPAVKEARELTKMTLFFNKGPKTGLSDDLRMAVDECYELTKTDFDSWQIK